MPSPVSAARAGSRVSKRFCEVTENFSAYSILQHRHVPEVLQISGSRSANSASPRNCCRSIAGSSKPSISARRASPAEELLAIYERRYAKSRSCASTTRQGCPTCAPSRGPISAISAVSFDAATGRAVVVSAIDNLVKGAAGQAVQNMNLMLGSRDRGTALKILVKLGGTLLERRSRARLAARSPGERRGDSKS